MEFTHKMPIEAVIFDLDGTLLDTECLSEQGMRQILQQLNGSELSWTLRKKLAGRPSEDACQVVISELHLDQLTTPKQMALQWEDAVKDMYGSVHLMPGAARIVKWMVDTLELPAAIATSSREYSFELKRASQPRFFDHFQVIVCGDDPAVHAGKPAPDIFLAAAKRLGVRDFSRVLVFEDSISGIRAAKAAGMNVVAIPDQRLHSTPEELALFDEADQVVASLADFDASPWQFVSPSSSQD